MQTNSDAESTSGHAFSEEDTNLDLEPKQEAILEDAGADIESRRNRSCILSELAPPKK